MQKIFTEKDLDPRLIKDLINTGISHPPPFFLEELHRIEVLSVRHRNDMNFLKMTPNIAAIITVGCNVKSFDFLKMLPEIESVSSWNSLSSDLSPLVEYPSIRSVEFDTCPIVDLEPLLKLPKLMMAKITGLPLSEHSYFKIIPELQSKLRYFKVFDDEVTWRMNCRLHAMSLKIGYTRNNAGEHYIGAMGTGTTPDPDGEGVQPLSIDRLRILLDRPDINERMIIEEGKKYLDERIASIYFS